MNIVYGSELSERMNQELAAKVAALTGRKPRLAVILVGEDPASQIYVRSKEKACHKVGIEAETFLLPAESREVEVAGLIERLNEDPAVDGILLQLPLPKGLDKDKLIDKIAAEKDVDGLTSINAGRLANGLSGHVPCTPLGVIDLLEEMGCDFSGKHAVIVGRTRLVGLPLIHLLLKKNCTVTVCHSRTQDLPAVCRQADILVTAVGKARMFTKDYIKEGVYAVDVGISRVDGKICGDLDFDNIKELCAGITPMPKGTGPMTIARLLRNTWQAYCWREGYDQ
ncbi:MAG: bifunctional 5,10-methylenetetrahydrofolate dehydrogenase/5,10-methenyltetrahydrofolate cyclohydrolase [Erysipelotrichaceae bacterium]|nr:bifunctional 5,10-methylenetetrahydrofolate dehydrogenase/5,10-methenyltetrahydrofolate cyclohydrolase [Erysipelotrichaceae bacterium]